MVYLTQRLLLEEQENGVEKFEVFGQVVQLTTMDALVSQMVPRDRMKHAEIRHTR